MYIAAHWTLQSSMPNCKLLGTVAVQRIHNMTQDKTLSGLMSKARFLNNNSRKSHSAEDGLDDKETDGNLELTPAARDGKKTQLPNSRLLYETIRYIKLCFIARLKNKLRRLQND